MIFLLIVNKFYYDMVKEDENEIGIDIVVLRRKYLFNMFLLFNQYNLRFNLGVCRLDVVVVMEVVILFVIMTANIDVNDVIGVMVTDEESKQIN